MTTSKKQWKWRAKYTSPSSAFTFDFYHCSSMFSISSLLEHESLPLFLRPLLVAASVVTCTEIKRHKGQRVTVTTASSLLYKSIAETTKTSTYS